MCILALIKSNTCIIWWLFQPEDTDGQLNVPSLELPQDLGIFIIWDFHIMGEGDAYAGASDQSNSSEESPLRSDQSLFSKESDSDTTDSDASRCDSPKEVIEHTITFKCIGTTKSGEYQNILSKAKKELSLGVSVRLMPEPDNPIDKAAIACQCYMNGKWMRIGYVIHELTAEVHDALIKNDITKVEFKWIRYMFKGFSSSPGFYAGINISRRGIWSSIAIAKSSTI